MWIKAFVLVQKSILILPKEFNMVVSNIKIVTGAAGALNYVALLSQLGVEQNLSVNPLATKLAAI